jgi:hypothetical protein
VPRANPDVDLQPADSIKFVFIRATSRRHAISSRIAELVDLVGIAPTGRRFVSTTCAGLRGPADFLPEMPRLTAGR